MIRRTSKEIDELLNIIAYFQEEGTPYPSQSYEDGLLDMYNWLTSTGGIPLFEQEQIDAFHAAQHKKD